jgi:hypothetical protein
MAAPIADKVILPSDTANTGKKIRTQTRVVGADTVHEHYFVNVSRRSKTGIYYYSPGLQSVQASAQDGTTTGFCWLINPVGSVIDLGVREVVLLLNGSAVAATQPRIILVKFTFTGTASGASVTPAKRKTSSDAAPVGSLRTTPTGLTITLGATAASFIAPAIITAASAFPTDDQSWPNSKDPLEDHALELEPGEGVVLYQADAGTATDPRRFVVNITAEELER